MRQLSLNEMALVAGGSCHRRSSCGTRPTSCTPAPTTCTPKPPCGGGTTTPIDPTLP